MSFAVVTDSLAGLPLEEVASRGLVVIPLSYYMNGEEHTCQAPEEYDSAAFFRAMKQRVEVKTSMIPPQRFAEYWEPLLQSDLDILFLSASSGISSSYQSASIAARQLEESYPERKIRVVDTLSSTLGEGLLVLRAFALREKGMSLDETADTILSLRPYIAHYFTVDDLLEALRGKDVFELSDVAFAIVETNGSVSVLKKFPRDTPCNEDLHIEPPTAKQPSLPLLVDGVLNPVNMRLYSVDADWIDAQCRNAGLARKDVLLFLCNDAKETSIVKKESR